MFGLRDRNSWVVAIIAALANFAAIIWACSLLATAPMHQVEIKQITPKNDDVVAVVDPKPKSIDAGGNDKNRLKVEREDGKIIRDDKDKKVEKPADVKDKDGKVKGGNGDKDKAKEKDSDKDKGKEVKGKDGKGDNVDDKDGKGDKDSDKAGRRKKDKPIPEEEKKETPFEMKVAAAMETIKDAELEFNDKPVVIPKALVEALLKWGDPAAEGFKFVSRINPLKTPEFDIHRGKLVGHMGLVGDYYVVAAPSADGIALTGKEHRLVILLYVDEDGVGKPEIVDGSYNGIGVNYRHDSRGYFLISKNLKKNK